MINKDRYLNIIEEIGAHAKLIAVSKFQSIEDIKEIYDLGQRDFAENRVQALLDRFDNLPKDIQWHLIGHLQTNKVKSILPFVAMIHSVDSAKLLQTIQTEAFKLNKKIDVLFQIHIAQEETKFGLDEKEMFELIENVKLGNYPNIQLCGLMGMATNTDDEQIVSKEFKYIQSLFEKAKLVLKDDQFRELSIGMSSDYRIALKFGATMIRIGSLLFIKESN